VVIGGAIVLIAGILIGKLGGPGAAG